MSGISSGIGLISGIDTARLIEQLIAIESRPIRNLEAQVQSIDVERTAYAELAAKLLALKNSALAFKKPSFFRQFSAKSSNENALLATASEFASAGTNTLRIHSLVSSHAVVTRGFATPDRSPLGIGTLTIESIRAKVAQATDLSELNGGHGVRRGSIRITDRSGATAIIDLTRALTMEDVLEAINGNGTIRVRASVTGLASSNGSGERLVIEDVSGGTGNLVVADVEGGTTAGDLGIRGSVTGSRLEGTPIYYLGMNTALSSLNDGNGVARFPQGTLVSDLEFTTATGSFGVSLTDVLQLNTDLRALNEGYGVRLGIVRVTDRAGNSTEIDLTDAKTIQDLRDAFNNSGLNISTTTVNSSFFITDTTVVPADTPQENRHKLKIEDVTGHTAADLGIAQEVDGESIRGRDVYKMGTLGDLVRAINFAPGNASLVEASISADGMGLVLRALTPGDTVFVHSGGESGGPVSGATADLGLEGATFTSDAPFTTRRLIGGINTTLLTTLRGGSGVDAGVVQFTDRAGITASIDFSSAQTLRDVIELINGEPTLGLVASINAAGNGIEIRDVSSGTGAITITDVSGSLASNLGIAGTRELKGGEAISGGNLQRQYLTRATRLAELNAGAGVQIGSFQIKNSLGEVAVVHLPASARTVGEVIDAINLAAGSLHVRAMLNRTGDGILVADGGGGNLALTISEHDGGTTARDLHLLGSGKVGENYIDGSFETRIDVAAADSLNDLASKINATRGAFSASVVNDGSSTNPYSLSITSGVSGRRGEMVIDAGGLDLGLAVLTRPQDALVTLGADASGGMLISSATNKIENALSGITLDLLAPTEEAITITTSPDVDGMVESMRAFVDAYNAVQEAIDKNTSFDPETFERGVLLGDATVSTIRNRLHRVMGQAFGGGATELSRMFSVGLRLGAGNKLEFDEEKFREAYENSAKDVEELFTSLETGFAKVFDETIDSLTSDSEGLISRKDQVLIDQQEVLKDRIESLNILLEAKRKRLEAQFASLETTLAALQEQQNSLGALSQLLARRTTS